MNVESATIIVQKNWRMVKARANFKAHVQKTQMQDSFGNPVSSAQLFNIFLLKIYEKKLSDPGNLIDEFNRVFHSFFKYTSAPISDLPELINYITSMRFKQQLDRHIYEDGKTIVRSTNKERKKDHEFTVKSHTRKAKEETLTSIIAGTTDSANTPTQLHAFFTKPHLRAIENYSFSSPQNSAMFFNHKRIPLVGHVSGTSLFLLNHLLKYEATMKEFSAQTKEMCLFIFIVLGIAGHHDLLECIYSLEMREATRGLFKIDMPVLKMADGDVYHTLVRKVLSTHFSSYPEYLMIFNQAFDAYYSERLIENQRPDSGVSLDI